MRSQSKKLVLLISLVGTVFAYAGGVLWRLESSPAAQATKYCSFSRDRYPKFADPRCLGEFTTFEKKDRACAVGCLPKGEFSEDAWDGCMAQCSLPIKTPFPERGKPIEQPITLATKELSVIAFAGTAPDDLHLLAHDNIMAYYDGSTWMWSSDRFDEKLTTISAPGRDDVWVAGENGFVAHASTDGWHRLETSALRRNTVDHLLAWSNGNAMAFVGGGVFRYVGSTWETASPVPMSLQVRGAWGASSRDVWIATQYAPVHWDGKTWSVKAPLEEPMNAVAGTGPDSAWMVGDHGAISHWDGRSWSPVQRLPGAKGAAFRAVSTWRPHRVFAVGDGVVAVYTGDVWEPWAPQEKKFTSVFAVPKTDDYVIGGELGPLVLHVH